MKLGTVNVSIRKTLRKEVNIMKWREMTKEQKHQWVLTQVRQMEEMKGTLDELITVFSQWGTAMTVQPAKEDKTR